MSKTLTEQLTETFDEITKKSAELERLHQRAEQLIGAEERRQIEAAAKPDVPKATTLAIIGDMGEPGAVCVSLYQKNDAHLVLRFSTPRDRDRAVVFVPWGLLDIALKDGVVKITKISHGGMKTAMAEEPALEFDAKGQLVIEDA